MPVLALPRCDTKDVHGVDFLQAPTMALADEEIDHNRAGETTPRKNVTIAIINRGGNVRREEADQEVKSPVGCRGQSHTLRAVSRGVDLSDDSPDDGTPCHCKARDEETCEDDHGITDTLIRCAVIIRKCEVTQRSKDEEAHKHPERSVDERRPATVLLDNVETRESHTEVDGAEDDGRDVRVRDAHRIKDRGAIVEVVVGSGKLLKCLQCDSKQRAIQHSWPSEDLIPWMRAAACAFGLELSLDLADLGLYMRMFLWHTIAECDRVTRTVDLAAAILPSRRLLHKQDANNHQERPDEADAHWELPRTRISCGFGAKVDAVCDEDAERDEQLIA